ncbi:MAG: hypothetical protein MJ239_03790 [Bacilli bacterium]|nr:hypothetical protein [Bacilli bacterium]
MREKLPSTIYYQDPLNDEFSTMEIKTPHIGGDYKYLRGGFIGGFLHVLYFRIIAKPLAFFYLKGKFHHKIIGKEKLKPYKKKAYFLYGNHTQIIGDALIPAFIEHPQSIHVIVHPNNTKIPGIGPAIPYLGGLPLPSDMAATRNFMNAIDRLAKGNKHIVIYPEAHLWPYYTGIRPFKDASFGYPVKYKTPVFCFTNTYHKRRNDKKVQIITYVDGPFFAPEGTSIGEAKKYLRDQAYNAMCQRAKNSDKEMIKYIEKGKEE